jgi:hypothetical protein
MQTHQSLDLKPWVPNAWVSPTGLVINRQHVQKVMDLPHAKATIATTAIIQRIIGA